MRAHAVGAHALWAGAAAVACIGVFGTSPSAAQEPESSYADETARELHTAALENRACFHDSVLKYTAVIRQRVGAALRTPSYW